MTSCELKEIAIKKTGGLAGLGRNTGKQRSTICKYFNGDRMPGVPVMRQMAYVLDVPFEDVVEAFYGPDHRTA